MAFTSVRRALAGQVPVPPAYTAGVKAKLERDRKSYAAFRAADQQQHDKAHEQRVAAAVSVAEDEVRFWHEDVEALEPQAAGALAVFRAAEDRAREAREFARQQLAAYERGRGKCSPQEEAESLIRSDTADQVASDAAKVMEGRQAELTAADESLAGVRQGLADAERQLDRARRAAQVPAGPAPISDAAIRVNAGYMQADEVWETLSREDRTRVQRLAQPRDLMSDEEFRSMMRDVLTMGGSRA